MFEVYHHERNLVGYGATLPEVHWPNEAYIAINFVVNYEEGGERGVLNGDECSERYLTDLVGTDAVQGMRRADVESLFEYGSRAGFWRLHRLFTQYSMPVTVFAVTHALRLNKEAVRAMCEAQWEIATHGDRWINYQFMPPQVEKEYLVKAVKSHAELCGRPPVGCYIGRNSPNSAMICAASEHFLYDADSYADDYPYYTQPLLHYNKDPRYQLMVPYTLDVNDMKYVGQNGFTESDQFFRYAKDQFDVLYEEGKHGKPKMMSVGLHCRIIGKPARCAGLIKFLEYIKSKPNVWIATREEIARHWIKTHPPPGPMFYQGAVETEEEK